MRATAVVYVGDLDRMRAFYEACLGLTPTDHAEGYCTLESEAWSLVLVKTTPATPETTPPPRRENTPVKLAFDVEDIESLRNEISARGGQLDAEANTWTFNDRRRCDATDPEGNVLQLIEREPTTD